MMASNHTNVAVFGVLVILLVALFALAVIGMIGYVIYYYVFRGLLAPVRRAHARVLRKTDRQRDVTVPLSRGYGNGVLDTLLDSPDSDPVIYRSADCFVTFIFEGGQQEFAVPESLYANLHEGDEGLLVYKGNLLKDFIPLS